MIAVYYFAAAWSVFLGSTALCYLQPDHVPDIGFYEPCRIGLTRFYNINGHLSDIGLGHHEDEDLFLDVYPLNYLAWEINSPRLQWFSGVTTMALRSLDIIKRALLRLLRFIAFLGPGNHNLPNEFTNHTNIIQTVDSLRQCFYMLLQHAVPPHQQLPVPLFTVSIWLLPAQPPVFGDFYPTCHVGLAGFYDVRTFAMLFNLGGHNHDEPDQNLVFPQNVNVLQQLNHEDNRLEWLNVMTSTLFRTSQVIHSAVVRVTNSMLWLNLAIHNVPLPGAFLNQPLPTEWRTRALASNSLLLACSISLLQLIGLPLQANVESLAI